MITLKVSWHKWETMSLLPLPPWQAKARALCSKGSSGSCHGHGLWCQKWIKWPMAEHAACFIFLPMYGVWKVIFPASRFQVFLLQIDTSSGDCSTMHGWSLKTLLSPEANLLHNSGSRKMTPLADSGDFGVEETTNHAWKQHDCPLHILKQRDITEQKNQKANKKLTEECAGQGKYHSYWTGTSIPAPGLTTRLHLQPKRGDIFKSKRFWTILRHRCHENTRHDSKISKYCLKQRFCSLE